MTRADALRNSGLDYNTWAKGMVEDGKMFYPEKRSIEFHSREKKTVVVRAPGGSMFLREEPKEGFSLTNFVCSTTGGSEEDYDTGKRKFCNAAPLKDTHDAVFTAYYSDGFCAGADDWERGACDFLVDLAVLGQGWFIKLAVGDAVADVCEFIFSGLHDVCQGKGGSAQLVFDKNNDQGVCGPPTCTSSGGTAINVGHIEAQFYEHDDGATCPAPAATQWCEKGTLS